MVPAERRGRLLSGDGLAGRLGDVRGGDAEHAHQIGGLAHLTEMILDADTFQRRGPLLRQHFRNGAAEPADDVVVFRRNQRAGFGGGLDDGVGVDGL